ncbi:MAG: hypothetical protein ACLGIP_18970, partial [Alphaproteobacteria bacterium]
MPDQLTAFASTKVPHRGLELLHVHGIAAVQAHRITQRNRPFHLVAVLRQLQVIDPRGCGIIRHRCECT